MAPSRRSLLASFLALPVASRFRPWVRPEPRALTDAEMTSMLLAWHHETMGEIIRQFVDAYSRSLVITDGPSLAGMLEEAQG